ncbi:MAG: hypothetical protein QOG53_3072 [Frankiales bacterium]|nr:hypothetical protein [Frankiales bacterium]
MRFTAFPEHRGLLELPWSVPLEKWPAELLASYPRGVSRHVVRFVRIDGTVYAVKEIGQPVAEKEYRLLRDLERRGLPVVRAIGVVTDRVTPDGEPLDAALVTRHLQFSLPYRAVFSRRLAPGTSGRLLDAMAELLVRLHLAGFVWNDCSLSNTLFRRDAETFAAYLVDAETGDFRDPLSDQSREYDVEVATENVAGELLDLAAGDLLDPSVDPFATARELAPRYAGLWDELTRTEVVDPNEYGRIEARIRRLNDLGYDVGEVQLSEEDDGSRLSFRTQVVEPGHHRRRLRELTGLDVEERQARRLLGDLDSYRAAAVMPGTDVDEATAARHWLTEIFGPLTSAVPAELRGKLEPAQLFHEMLDHRWYLSEQAGHEVRLEDAADDYLRTVLTAKPDESAVLIAPDLRTDQ